eukprot:CAMPEP_0181205318 /NCGR_PEP_ID=MMETSP1096-20121128/20410_1 /TAXON_ID=156174 ORGANISM="Chrysochromulina ericina, Strain CCMP281" /NCGR_SAMPLE_ID=MMETSP1096 /ASSEMBLY_ACC=CAM_ASM_000453 /LENGTH=203 /DNA_ID=CAMNT_0023296087 /DNA_START=448 /DNA_END=1060 /DNA_ORIENTATION=+
MSRTGVLMAIGTAFRPWPSRCRRRVCPSGLMWRQGAAWAWMGTPTHMPRSDTRAALGMGMQDAPGMSMQDVPGMGTSAASGRVGPDILAADRMAAQSASPSSGWQQQRGGGTARVRAGLTHHGGRLARQLLPRAFLGGAAAQPDGCVGEGQGGEEKWDPDHRPERNPADRSDKKEGEAAPEARHDAKHAADDVADDGASPRRG